MADPSSSYCPRSCFDPDKPPDWFVNLFSTTFIYYTIFSLLPGMLTAAHTLLLAPLVPVYMALAYPISALLKTLGLLKHKDIPPLGPTGWKGKVVFVTGASAGIGLATARNLARYVRKVLLHVYVGACVQGVAGVSAAFRWNLASVHVWMDITDMPDPNPTPQTYHKHIYRAPPSSWACGAPSGGTRRGSASWRRWWPRAGTGRRRRLRGAWWC